MTLSHRADRIFEGPLAETSRVSFELRDPEGGVFEASVVTRINAEQDPSLVEKLDEGELNWVESPGGDRWRLASPVVYHHPADEEFTLVVPKSLAHRELEWRRRLMQNLEARVESIPPYIRDFTSRIGVADHRVETPDADDDGSIEEEVTHTVTEDQFVSVTSEPVERTEADRPEVAPAARPKEGAEGVDVLRRPSRVVVEPIEGIHLPDEFDSDRAVHDRFVDVVDGRVLAAAQIDAETSEALARGEPAFFLQLHRIEETPLAALLLAALDDDAQPIETVGWPLDLSKNTHRTVLSRLSEHTALDLALYDGEGRLSAAYAVDAPLEANVEWIRNQVEDALADPDSPAGEPRRAAEQYLSDDFPRLGRMRLEFGREVEGDFDGLSEILLATGIIGYWSSDEAFSYLVANRSFPLERFRAIQRRVIEAALEAGIYLNEPLRRRAIDEGMVTDEVELIEMLLANFAEVSTGLRSNDLEPMDEWDNWDKLVQFAREVGVTPDTEVLELAESRLERAKRHAADSDETSS